MKKENKKSDFFTSGIKAHFVGIGGIGMCGLAELLYRSGGEVTGSDLICNAQTKRLKKIGITVFKGHRKENISGAEVLIQSSAVSDSCIEIQQAQKQNLPIMTRSGALAEMMRLKRGLVVAGTHGKTTTTHFLSLIFLRNKKDPTVFIGGRSHLFRSTAFLGKSPWFIAESDESDGGFKYLSPEIAVITNIDKDHLDHYGSFSKLKAAFLSFALKVPFYGAVVACGDDKTVYKLLSKIDRKVLFYGFQEHNHFFLKPHGNLKYKVFVKGKQLGILNTPLYGSMNALNALAACATAMTTGMSFSECNNSFKHFKGLDRRFHRKGRYKQILFYDDYAHHPTEIRQVLSAFREKFTKKKNQLVVLFQPHRYSRTLQCWSDFCSCFNKADRVFLIDTYSAGEKPIKKASSSLLAQAVEHSFCEYLSEENILPILSKTLTKGDVFITMGAGSVYKWGEKLISLIKKK